MLEKGRDRAVLKDVWKDVRKAVLRPALKANMVPEPGACRGGMT
jgi:hypothetical protein